MQGAKLIITFERLSEPNFLTKSGTIVAALTDNDHYPEPWVTQVPSLAQLTTSHMSYQDSYHASLTRDILKIAQRKTARQALADDFKRLAPYLEMVAQGDVAILATTGYDLHKKVVRGANNGDLPAPSDFRVTHGQKGGTLDVHIARLSGAGSYEVQTAQGDPSLESNWTHALSSLTCNRIQLTGLTPSQSYWVRMRGISSNGAGVWTEPMNCDCCLKFYRSGAASGSEPHQSIIRKRCGSFLTAPYVLGQTNHVLHE